MPTGTLLDACSRVIGAHLDRYPPDAAAPVFSLLPGRALETIAAVAAEKRLFDDALVGLVVGSDVERLAIAGETVTDAGLNQIVPSSAGTTAVSAWDSAPVQRFSGCLRLRALALDVPQATAAFIAADCGGARLRGADARAAALSTPGQAPRAAADAVDALDGCDFGCRAAHGRTGRLWDACWRVGRSHRLLCYPVGAPARIRSMTWTRTSRPRARPQLESAATSTTSRSDGSRRGSATALKSFPRLPRRSGRNELPRFLLHRREDSRARSRQRRRVWRYPDVATPV